MCSVNMIYYKKRDCLSDGINPSSQGILYDIPTDYMSLAVITAHYSAYKYNKKALIQHQCTSENWTQCFVSLPPVVASYSAWVS